MKSDPFGSLVVALLAVDACTLAIRAVTTVPLMPVELLDVSLLLLICPDYRIVRAVGLILCLLSLALLLLGGFWSLVKGRLKSELSDIATAFHSAYTWFKHLEETSPLLVAVTEGVVVLGLAWRSNSLDGLKSVTRQVWVIQSVRIA